MGFPETRMTLIVLMGALCWNRIEVFEIIGGYHPVPGEFAIHAANRNVKQPATVLLPTVFISHGSGGVFSLAMAEVILKRELVQRVPLWGSWGSDCPENPLLQCTEMFLYHSLVQQTVGR
jgi:hypothetical protein